MMRWQDLIEIFIVSNKWQIYSELICYANGIFAIILFIFIIYILNKNGDENDGTI